MFSYLCMQSHSCCSPLLPCQVTQHLAARICIWHSIGWHSLLFSTLIGSLPHVWAYSLHLWQWPLCALPLPLRPLRRLRRQQRRGRLPVQAVRPQPGVHLQQWPLHRQGVRLQWHQQLLRQRHYRWAELPWVKMSGKWDIKLNLIGFVNIVIGITSLR